MRTTRLKQQLMLIAAGCLATAAVACTEIDPEDLNGTPAGTPSPGSGTPTQVQTVIPTPEPTLTPTPEAGDDDDADDSPSAPSDPGDLDGALAAAARVLGVPFGDDCTEGGDCVREMPTGETNTAGPITRLAYMSADGGGAVVIVGRDGAGVWQYWQITQFATYFLFDVPGELRVCPDSPSLAVRTSPSSAAEVAGELPRGATATADTFTLTEPGTLDEPGSGWYRVSGEVEGWVPSTSTADASTGDCSLRDEVEGDAGSVG